MYKWYILHKDYTGSLGVALTRNCTYFLKIGFVVAGGGFYSYYIYQGNELDKEMKIVRYDCNSVRVQFQVTT